MYKITENLEVGLNKVTPRALISLNELGLYGLELENEDIMKTLLDIFINKDKFDKLLKTIFKDVKEYVFEDVDLSEVFGGYKGFLFALIGSSSE